MSSMVYGIIFTFNLISFFIISRIVFRKKSIKGKIYLHFGLFVLLIIDATIIMINKEEPRMVGQISGFVILHSVWMLITGLTFLKSNSAAHLK